LHPERTGGYWPFLEGSLEVIEAKGKSCKIRSLYKIAKVMVLDGVFSAQCLKLATIRAVEHLPSG
jgi:hypothetical protein